MTKISYEERINLYYDRKNGMSFTSLKSKYGINKSGVEYLVRLIDKHGFDILRTNENKSYSSMEKERLKRLLESILKVEIYDIKERNTELDKTNKKNKKLVLDLVLDTNVGKINVEVNNNSDNYIIKRNLLYFFRLIGMCLKEAEDYEKIEQLYVEGEERRVRNTERKLGREEGLEQGLEQGVKQGHKEEKIEIAKNMLKDNVDIDIITKYTGLSSAEIKALKK